MQGDDIIDVYSELENLRDIVGEIKKVVEGHSNHLSTLDARTEMIWTFLKIMFPPLLGLIGAVLTAVLLRG